MRNWTFLLSERAQRTRAVIVASATVLLFAAMLISFRQMPRQADTQVLAGQVADSDAADGADALAEFETQRAASRVSQMAELDRLIDGDDAQLSADAAQQKLELVGFMEAETTLEGLLRAQGYAGAVCTVHSDSCNVLVRASALDDAQVASILSLASAETGLSAANIKIIPVD